MLIIGAKGFAKEVLEILFQLDDLEQVAFFDNLTADIPEKLFGKFSVLRTDEDAIDFLKEKDNKFTLGLGNPYTRWKLYKKFVSLGGLFTSTISPKANIGHFGNSIGTGCNIMTGVVLTNDVSIGKGCLINLNCTVGHDSIIGEFVEMSPGVHISGNVQIGRFCNIGTNATILPRIKIGENVVVGAGAVVTKDIPDNCLVVGVPGEIKKQISPITT